MIDSWSNSMAAINRQTQRNLSSRHYFPFLELESYEASRVGDSTIVRPPKPKLKLKKPDSLYSTFNQQRSSLVHSPVINNYFMQHPKGMRS